MSYLCCGVAAVPTCKPDPLDPKQILSVKTHAIALEALTCSTGFKQLCLSLNMTTLTRLNGHVASVKERTMWLFGLQDLPHIPMPRQSLSSL